MKYSEIVKKQNEILVKAENLKEELWAFIELFGDPSFDIKTTMNQLLDEIDSLEFDHMEEENE